MSEMSIGRDAAAIHASTLGRDSLNWDVLWTCEKWSEDACNWIRRKLDLAPEEEVRSWMLRKFVSTPDLGVEEIEGNLLVNAGIQRMIDLLIAAGGQALDATHSRVGVGSSSPTAAASDTDLAAATGATTRYWAVMNSTFPSRSGQTVSYQADFTSSNGNFHWQEWGIDAGTAAGTGAATAPLLNHKAEDLGTKATGTWTLTGAITIS